MKPRSQERGQALILIALAVVGLFGFSALAIDGSRVFSDRRNAQNAADTAALAAALAKVRGQAYVAAAEDRAQSNGYVDDADSTVDVYLCSQVIAQGLTPPCEGIPPGENPANFIQVKIQSTIPATFARVIGRTQFSHTLTAVARAGSADPLPLANGNALAAMAPNEPDAIFGNGNINLDVNNSGIFSNSSVSDPQCHNGSMSTVGNGLYSVDTSIQVAGSFCQGNNTTVQSPGGVQSTGQLPYPPEISIKIPEITCSGTGTSSFNPATNTTTFSPGNFGSINLNSTGNIHFSPGDYCFNGGVSVGGTADIIANDVNFLVSSGAFNVTGSSTFTCNDMLVHIDGGSGMHFNGNGGNYCNNVSFIASTGAVTWNGNVSNRFYAPTGGDYENVLIYMPYGNSSPLSITGNAGNELTGSIIAVSSPITVGGNNWTTGLNSQIIGYTVDIQGNSNLVINYVPGDQYVEPIDSNVQLTK